MNKIVLLLLLLPAVKFSFAQNGENPLPFFHEEAPFDTAPQFHGGPEAMLKYFADSIRYPEPEKTKHIQGYVYVKFKVSATGEVINVELINGVPGGPNLAKEAVRVMQSMPLWIPATKHGKPVEAEYNLSVPFKIENR